MTAVQRSARIIHPIHPAAAGMNHSTARTIGLTLTTVFVCFYLGILRAPPSIEQNMFSTITPYSGGGGGGGVEKQQQQELHLQVPINQALPGLPRMPANMQEMVKLILERRKNHTTTTSSRFFFSSSPPSLPRATFLQIGANDGQMFDPLYEHMKQNKDEWIGLQVEPQPELYSRLCVLHADAPDWAFYHGALAPASICRNGTITFCETRTPGVGDWDTQGQINRITENCPLDKMHHQTRPCVISFDDLIYRHASPIYLQHVMEEQIVTTNVSSAAALTAPGRTTKAITTIARKNNHKLRRKFHVDLLQIDVEGKDFDILEMNDWELMSPVCVQYEHSHLGEERKTKALQLMQKWGYTLRQFPMDVLACRVASNRQQDSTTAG